jgi:hypothetical protein
MEHLNSSCTKQVCALITPQDFSAYMYCEDTLPGVQWLGLKLTTQFHLEEVDNVWRYTFTQLCAFTACPGSSYVYY